MKKYLLFIIALVSFQSLLFGQTFATTISSESEVDISSNAIDGDLATSADVRASTGILAGIGAYSGHLELEFPTSLDPNTTSYVKLETEEDLLPYLLGGSLGGLLSDIGGVVLIGNQEFTVAAKNNNTTVWEESSSDANAFSTHLLRVVTDVNNDYFLAIAPNSQYNRVRLTNQIGSLIGLNNTRTLEIYGAFHSQELLTCGTPSFTSFSGNGLTLDLLGIGGAGVADPHLAIDSATGTFSQLGLGILGVAASIEQTIYFDTRSQSGENYYLTLAIDPSLLQAGIANNIEIIAQNGSSAPSFTGSLSNLLNIDLLTLLQSGQPATIGFDPGGDTDRVTIQLSSLLNVSLDQNIQLFEVYRAPELPSIDPTSQDISICEGNTANLVATTPAGNELLWYDAETNGNLLDTVNSGEAFTTPILNTDTTYYVSARGLACPEESPRVAVTVNVVEIPTASDIDVSGDENPVCSSSDVVLVPSSAIDGEFSWYFDANATNEITNGQMVGSVTYTIDPVEGTLTITGLDQAGSPYNYFVRITEATAGCENAVGDLQTATVSIVDSGASVTISAVPTITLDILASLFQIDPTFTVSGSVTGNANPGDAITLNINGQSYAGTLDGSLGFNVDVDGTDLALDSNGIIDVFIDGGLCTLTGEINIDLPVLIIDELVQTFCSSDDPTLLDLVVNDNNIVFFDSLNALVSLDLTTPLVDGEVYFAGILDVPLSVLARIGITVNLTDPPPPTTSESTQTFCESDNPTVADIQVNESNVVFYDSASGGQELDPSTPLEDEEYHAAIREASGCESTSRLQITVVVEDEEPITLSGQAEDACLEDQYTYSTETGKQNYTWTVIGGAITNGGSPSDDFVTVSWNNLQNASVSVHYEDSMGCVPMGDTRLEVEVMDCGDVMGEEFCLEVYNEFSPNNDGFNDFFEIECIENYANTVQVFNRNGNKVFESVNYQNNWDGIANVGGILNKGEHLPSGTYYYVIKIPELNRNLAGWLQLAR